MAHPDSILKISLGLNGLSFDLSNQHIQIEQGLSFINSKSISHGVIDELAIEKMIYFIEEIIESKSLRNNHFFNLPTHHKSSLKTAQF